MPLAGSAVHLKRWSAISASVMSGVAWTRGDDLRSMAVDPSRAPPAHAPRRRRCFATRRPANRALNRVASGSPRAIGLQQRRSGRKNLGLGNVEPTYRLAMRPWSFLDVQPRSARPVISFPHQKPSGLLFSLRPSHAKTPRSSGGFSLVTNDDGGASGDDDDASVRWQPSVRQSLESGQL
jgi:hypothetical protein